MKKTLGVIIPNRNKSIENIQQLIDKLFTTNVIKIILILDEDESEKYSAIIENSKLQIIVNKNIDGKKIAKLKSIDKKVIKSIDYWTIIDADDNFDAKMINKFILKLKNQYIIRNSFLKFKEIGGNFVRISTDGWTMVNSSTIFSNAAFFNSIPKTYEGMVAEDTIRPLISIINRYIGENFDAPQVGGINTPYITSYKFEETSHSTSILKSSNSFASDLKMINYEIGLLIPKLIQIHDEIHKKDMLQIIEIIRSLHWEYFLYGTISFNDSEEFLFNSNNIQEMSKFILNEYSTSRRYKKETNIIINNNKFYEKIASSAEYFSWIKEQNKKRFK